MTKQFVLTVREDAWLDIKYNITLSSEEIEKLEDGTLEGYDTLQDLLLEKIAGQTPLSEQVVMRDSDYLEFIDIEEV